MARVSQHSVARLPEALETWQIITTRLRMWISPEDKPPFRPHAIFIFVLENGLLMGAQVTEGAPTPGQVRDVLFTAMAQPSPEVGPPRRPQAIAVADPALAEELASLLAKARLEMTIIEMPPPDEFQDIVKDFERHLHRGKPELPGLLSVQSVTPDLVAGFFAAAAEFYRAAPWVHLTNSQMIAVRQPAEPDYRYAVVMGNGGVEYGLAMYLTWADLEHLHSPVDNPIESMPASGLHSMFYEKIDLLPFDDLEALEQHGWEIAGEDAYPIPIVVEKGGDARRPDLIDLLWYEAALRAIPIFVRDHLRPDGLGDYRPVETAIVVTTHTGPIAVGVKYPAGEVSLESQPAHAIDWSAIDFGAEDDEDFEDFEDFDEFDEFDELDELDELEDEALDEFEDMPMPFFDRRGMEGMLSQIAGQMGAKVGSGDPDLDRAQEMMFQAWTESNPARRLALAHQALSISPDCADAYVLLAEEEADTVGRALVYYQQGVAAGERALGEDYFKNAIGHFWGILETRPYMRAREGLANTLWRLNRKEEAVAHYQDMLRLNEGDNQGVRYVLLNLLLHLNREADAAQLLRKYRGDWSAEWHYTRALLEFRKSGESARANKALAQAFEQNPHVPAYLIGRKRIPRDLPDYIGTGDENEAVSYASEHLNHWRRTPGAVEWLVERMSVKPAPARRRPIARPKSKSKPRPEPKPRRTSAAKTKPRRKGKAK